VVEKTNLLNELLSGCIQGERRSQQLVYTMFSGKMKAVCLRYLKSREDAEDLLQEGFIKAFQNIHQFKFEGSFEGWLRRMFVHLCIDWIRKQKNKGWNTEFTDEKHDRIDDGEEPEDVTLPEITPQQILASMDQLTPVYRAVFNLIAFEQFTHQEVADQLGISVGTSKSNYSKAKRNIQRILLDLNARK
jgi:RNA polymerase sigma-70 factor (ECF subfamily)